MSYDQQQQQGGGFLDSAQKAAGVIGGHAQFAHGAAQEQIGGVLNSDEWKKSGTDTKDEAGKNIKEAFNDFKRQNDESSNLAGKASEIGEQGESTIIDK